jgi:hypothetical protein
MIEGVAASQVERVSVELVLCYTEALLPSERVAVRIGAHG